MATQGATSAQKTTNGFVDLIYYLNPTTTIHKPFQEHEINTLSEENVSILFTVLQATQRDHVKTKGIIQLDMFKTVNMHVLNLKIAALTEQNGLLLAKLIEKGQFQSITLKIDCIPDTATHAILKAIGGNLQSQQIDIQIPNYVTNNIHALRQYLKNPPTEQKAGYEADFEELEQAFEQLMSTSKEKLGQATEYVANTAMNWFDTGKTFLTQLPQMLELTTPVVEQREDISSDYSPRGSRLDH